MSSAYPEIRLLRFEKNAGQSAAMFAPDAAGEDVVPCRELAAPVALDEQEVRPQDQRRHRRQDRDVDPVEAGERGAGDVRAAAQNPRKQVPDHRNLRRNVRADLRREKGERVPREQVSGEPEPECEEEEQRSGHPRHLARSAIRLEEEDRDQVGENHAHEEVGSPRVNRPDEPAERHVGHDVLNALESLRRARPVVEEQEDSRRDLYEEEKQRHPAEVVEERVPVNRDPLLGGDVGEVPDQRRHERGVLGQQLGLVQDVDGRKIRPQDLPPDNG